VQLRTTLLTTSIALLALAATACTGGDSSDPTATATAEATSEATATAETTATATATAVPATATSAPTATPTATPPPATATAAAPPSGLPIVIKFSRHPASDSDPSAVFDVPRISPNSGVARYAIEQLLAGPNAPEKANGFFTPWTDFTYGAVSDCGGDPFELTLVSSVLTVRFCTTVTLLGAVADGQANVAMTETLLQFSTITRVNILNQANDCLIDPSGLNLCLAP
jgi:hypothetical protein